MNSYLIIEDMKIEALSDFKIAFTSKSIYAKNSRYKIKLNLTNEEFHTISKLKGSIRNIPFTYKTKGKFLAGNFSIESILTLSKFKSNKIVSVEVCYLKYDEMPKDFHRDLLLGELLG